MKNYLTNFKIYGIIYYIKTNKGGVAMKRNKSYITKLLEASSTVEAYRIRTELEEKLRTGFKPDEIRSFVYELLEFVYDYKQLKKDIAVMQEFAEVIAKYISVSEEI
jgi:hypothetical protein